MLIAQEVERRRENDKTAADSATLERRVREIATRQAKLARLASALEDEDAAAPLLHELRSLARQKRDLEAEQRRLACLAGSEASDINRLTDLAAWCQRVTSNLELLTYEQKRLVLDALGVQARVWKTDHEPRWDVRMSLPVDGVAPDLSGPSSRSRLANAAD
jgi:site-specific DNA recombinase